MSYRHNDRQTTNVYMKWLLRNVPMTICQFHMPNMWLGHIYRPCQIHVCSTYVNSRRISHIWVWNVQRKTIKKKEKNIKYIFDIKHSVFFYTINNKTSCLYCCFFRINRITGFIRYRWHFIKTETVKHKKNHVRPN